MTLWKWWIAIAGTALVVGGVAWLLKLWVIIATDGQVVATGAAGAFFDLGFYSLMVGSTGVGLRLAINLENTLRVTSACQPVSTSAGQHSAGQHFSRSAFQPVSIVSPFFDPGWPCEVN